MSKKGLKDAVQVVNKYGILLVYPITNRKHPRSLWSVFYPRSEMKWEWDEEGDTRVADLWHLREELSRSGQVVYAKWYQGRATFFSKDVFRALLALAESHRQERALSPDARNLLEILKMDSPLSTKQLKASSDLRGKFNESRYTRALKSLWDRFLVVGFGQVDDGAFPSLAIGATETLFEDLWNESRELSRDEAVGILHDVLDEESPVWKTISRL